MRTHTSHRLDSLYKGLRLALLAVMIAPMSFGCGDDDKDDPSTVGSLAVSVSPHDAAMSVTGPGSYSETFDGSETLTRLQPGEYFVTAESEGYEGQTDGVTITAGHVSVLVMSLRPIGSAGSTTGALAVSVAPSRAEVTLTGPDDYSESFTGSETFLGLTPGIYTAMAAADGFVTEEDSVAVYAGGSSSVTLLLSATGTSTTAGALNIGVQPTRASVTVTGPNDYETSFRGSETLSGLEPGEYRAEASADGYVTAVDIINVRAGVTSTMTLNLLRPASSEAPRYVYRDGDANLIPLARTDVTTGRFVFYAWLEDLPGGIDTSARINLGAPLLSEQNEFAPSFTQNMAGAWVGFRDANGDIRPVIGAEVRWEIDQFYESRIGSMQYGVADGVILDDQADTFTNNGRLFNELYPVGVDYPVYNTTGIGAPNVDGFTWVTLFSPDARASGRIVAVASVYGVEIGKEILHKDFAPTPVIEITKEVDDDIINLEVDDDVEFTVTVRNVGDGDATNVNLSDYLGSGDGASYSLSALPGTATASGDGFDISFPLDAGEEVDFTFTATVTNPGIYCNVAEIEEFSGVFDTREPVGLDAEACFTATEPELSIIKDFVSVVGGVTTSLGPDVTVGAGETARLRVRVVNFGTGDASVVSVVDALTTVDGTAVTGNNPNYAITLPVGGTVNANDGYNMALGTVAAGDIETMNFTVTGTVDGEYCDTATVFIDSVDEGDSTACLTVSSPNLVITKTNTPTNVFPGDSYRSTIVVTNDGSAAAHGVVLADLLGINTDAPIDEEVVYVSSSLGGVSGILDGRDVMTRPMTIAPGASVTFTVFSLIPFGGAAGEYCDVGSFTSDDAGTGSAEACVDVPSFSALQTQLTDLGDPVHAGSTVAFQSVLFIEPRSNEGVDENSVIVSFGLDNPADLGDPGTFRHISTRVYIDTSPTQDGTTGLVTSDPSNVTAVLMAEGLRYTVDNSVAGRQVVEFDAGFELQPNEAIYLVHELRIPAGTAVGQYTTSYIWTGSGSSIDYESSSSESTTVLE